MSIVQWTANTGAVTNPKNWSTGLPTSSDVAWIASGTAEAVGKLALPGVTYTLAGPSTSVPTLDLINAGATTVDATILPVWEILIGSALFRGAVSKDTVSRTWRKVQTDWKAWCQRSLAEEDMVRLMLDGTTVRVRLDRKATSISQLVVRGIRRDGQKALLAVRNMGGESEAAWKGVLNEVQTGFPVPSYAPILDTRRRPA